MNAAPGIAYLIIDSPRREDSGKLFKCIVFFADKTTAILDPPSLLNVWYLDKPAITVSRPTNSAYEGQSFTLTCSNINGNPPTPIQVTWLKDNIIISNDSSRYDIHKDFKSLRMPVASVKESGNYQCRVENEINEGETSLNLNISVIKFYLNKPNVTSTQSVVYEGNSFTLTCNNINANPPSPIYVTWLKDNIIISNDSSRYEIYEELNRIRIPFASVYDNGNYQCRVENDAEREGMTSLKLSILIIKFFINATFTHDSKTGIATCIGDGHPMPSYLAIFYNGGLAAEGEFSASFNMDKTTCRNASIICFTRNSQTRTSTQLQKFNTDKYCVPDFQHKQSTMVLICTTFAALILGSLSTFLICHYIRKKKERGIHRQYQNSQYQALDFRPTSSVYKELNKVNDDASSTAKNDTNTPSVVDETCDFDSIYEDVKE